MCNTGAVEQGKFRKVCDSDEDQEDSGLETHTEGWKHLAGNNVQTSIISDLAKRPRELIDFKHNYPDETHPEFPCC